MIYYIHIDMDIWMHMHMDAYAYIIDYLSVERTITNVLS